MALLAAKYHRKIQRKGLVIGKKISHRLGQKFIRAVDRSSCFKVQDDDHAEC